MHAEPKQGASVELGVDYKRLNTFFADYVKNISRGGTFIATQRPLAIGTEFLFVLGVPKLEQPLVLGGTVTDVTDPEASSKANPAGMTVEIEYESPEERKFVQDTVRALMERELGTHLTAAMLA